MQVLRGFESLTLRHGDVAGDSCNRVALRFSPQLIMPAKATLRDLQRGSAVSAARRGESCSAESQARKAHTSFDFLFFVVAQEPISRLRHGRRNHRAVLTKEFSPLSASVRIWYNYSMSVKRKDLLIPYGVSDFRRIRNEGYYSVRLELQIAAKSPQARLRISFSSTNRCRRV